MFLNIFLLLAGLTLSNELDTDVNGPFNDFELLTVDKDVFESPKESKNIYDLVAVAKWSSNIFINQSRDVEFKGEDSFFYKILKDNFVSTPFVELRSLLNLHDDLRFEIPVKVSLSHGLIKERGNFLAGIEEGKDPVRDIARNNLVIQTGLWLSWDVTEWFRFGLRGSLDDLSGYLFSYTNVRSVAGESLSFLDAKGRIYTEFSVSPVKWYKFQPEIALDLGHNHPLNDAAKGINSIDLWSVSAILPSKFTFKFVHDLALKANISLKEQISSSNKLVSEIKGSVQLEHSILDTVVLKLPIKAAYKNEFNIDKKEASNKVTISTVPSADINWQISRYLLLVIDAAFDYKFFEAKNSDVSWLTSPTIKLGFGLKFDSR